MKKMKLFSLIIIMSFITMFLTSCFNKTKHKQAYLAFEDLQNKFNNKLEFTSVKWLYGEYFEIDNNQLNKEYYYFIEYKIEESEELKFSIVVLYDFKDEEIEIINFWEYYNTKQFLIDVYDETLDFYEKAIKGEISHIKKASFKDGNMNKAQIKNEVNKIDRFK